MKLKLQNFSLLHSSLNFLLFTLPTLILFFLKAKPQIVAISKIIPRRKLGYLLFRVKFVKVFIKNTYIWIRKHNRKRKRRLTSKIYEIPDAETKNFITVHQASWISCLHLFPMPLIFHESNVEYLGKFCTSKILYKTFSLYKTKETQF